MNWWSDKVATLSRALICGGNWITLDILVNSVQTLHGNGQRLKTRLSRGQRSPEEHGLDSFEYSKFSTHNIVLMKVQTNAVIIGYRLRAGSRVKGQRLSYAAHTNTSSHLRQLAVKLSS